MPPVRAAGSGDGGDGWASDVEGPLAELRNKLEPLGRAFRDAVQALWRAQKYWLQHALARAALGLATLAAAATAVANLWAVPALNARLLPQVQEAATRLLQREVQLGAVRWVAATGVVGLTPLASVGPVSVGAAPVERSAATARHVTVGVDPLQSVLQHRVVLEATVHDVKVDLVQAANYSWFGYPEDTVPSARNFVPGAGGPGSGGTSGTADGGGGGGAASTGSSSDSGGSGGGGEAVARTTSSSSRVAQAPAEAAPGDAKQRMEALAGHAASSSRQLQMLVERLTQELAAAAQDQQHLAACAAGSSQPSSGAPTEQQPAMVLMGLGGAGRDLPQHAPSASATSSSLHFDPHPPSGSATQSHDVARVAPGSSGGGFFGGKLGWRRGAASPQGGPQQDAPQPQPPSSDSTKASRRQRQLAALNAMRLQAGRGYSAQQHLQQQQRQEQRQQHRLEQQQQQQQEPTAASPVASTVADAVVSRPQATELQAAQQLERQHRKKRRKGAAGVQQQVEQAAQQAVPAATGAQLSGSSSSSGVAPAGTSRDPTAGGSAAALNRQLRPLRVRSGKLYTASAAQHSLLTTAARTAEAAQVEAAADLAERVLAAAGVEQAAPDSAGVEEAAPAVAGMEQEAAAVAATSADEEAAAVAGVETAAAAAPVGAAEAAAGPSTAAAPSAVPAAPTMTAQQRRTAVGLINSLPTIQVRQYRQPAAGVSSSAATDAEPGPAAAEREASPAVRSINQLGAVEAPEDCKPSARVSRTAQHAFAAAVVDPATLHKKLGSAALPWSHQRPPASSLIGQRLGTASPAAAGEAAAQASRHTAAAVGEGGASAATAGEGAVAGQPGEAAYQMEGDTGSDGDAARQPAPAASATTRRHPLLHPGYFTRARGPSYTPAPPEALIDARARRTTLATFLRSALSAAVSQVHMPQVALGSIQLQRGTVDAYVHGEALPRRFQDVSASVRLGRDYDSLAVEVTASPHERHPSAAKCTKINPHAHRHLRHVTGLAASRAYQQNLAAAAEGDAAAAEAAAAAAEGRPDFPAAAATSLDADTAYARTPTGGRVRITVQASSITSGSVPAPGTVSAPGVPVPALDISVRGQGLHAPIIERLIELPMDISAGRADGELRIRSHDADSWHFPEFYGRVAVRGAEFHFWDATDDITGADLDLVFERDCLYLHNTSGAFGAVPMTLTGALDLNPQTGQYRLSATVPGVEVNALRATLGVRPTPQPVAGAVAGVLHVTGPLEKPVFSGSARAVRPTSAQLADCEPTEALAALLAEPGAVGAFDRVPVASAGAVFALDTAQETLQLHAAHAELADGGQLRGSGRMWVAPCAEMDPSAVSFKAEGQDLGMEAVARRYMPEGVAPPPGMAVGRASLAATMQGSHMEPTIDVALQLPEASAACTAQLSRGSARLSLASPSADAAGTLHLAPPSFEAVKAALTQRAATALAQPVVTGLDADVAMRGLDVVPLVSGEQALRQLAVQSGTPLRLKLNGRARVSGTVTQQGGGVPAAGPAWLFAGDLGLESVRVNQLKLWQKLAGRLLVSSAGVSVHGKGLRANETLDLDLALPLLAPQAAAQPAVDMPEVATAAAPEQQMEPAAAPEQQAEQPEGDAEAAAGAAVAQAEAAVAAPEPTTAAAQQPTPQAQAQQGGGGLQLRCGPLQVAANVDATGSQLDFKVAALKLDELELASLRGDLQEVSCSLNFGSHTGRGKVSLANPRYSGLRGDSLSGGFRWERDVVRLEKLVLQQQRSRYEVQGEYSIPASTLLPSSAADLARSSGGETGGGVAAAPPGRWRVQVSVPAAELQEVVPAARLLQSATSLSPAEYERARTSFLQAIDSASIKADELNKQLRAMAERLQPEAASGTAGSSAAASPESKNASRGGAAGLQLPGLQDVRGQWSGSIQAYGGGGGATSCDFDVKGQTWQWGSYALDALVANGSYHSEEGVQLQEFVLKAGDAKLLVRGSLLGEHQDASVLLTDFPMTTLRPIFRAVPALQNAAPAVPAEAPQPVASPRPLGMLTNVLGRATKGLQQGGDADSPINGLLYVSGNITGSRAQPTGEVAVRLYDAAVGTTRLSQAQGSARLSEAQQLSFNVEVVPAEGHRQAGYVRAAGVVPLADASAAAGSGAGQLAAAQPPHHGAHHHQHHLQAAAQHMDVRLSIKDGGMAILTSITPDMRWQSGQAAIDVRLRGPVDQPVLSGCASIAKATLDCPVLRFPLTNVSAEVRAGEDLLTVEALEARCGRRGHIRVRGSLPVYGAGGGGRATAGQPALRLVAEASGLELRVRNMYSGQYDAQVAVTSSLASPSVAGTMRFSKGMVFIVPQGAPDVAGTATGSGGDALLTPSGGAASPQQGSVAKVFDILTRGESGLAQQFEQVMKQEVEAVEHMVEDAAQHNVSLDGLSICLGPDLRALYPLVMNFGVEGELTVNGPAHPDQVRVSGTVRLPSGDVNLVATQLALDREHANLITFQPDQLGLDPLVDVVMNGGDLRVTIKGRASEWQDHLALHYVSDKARPDSGEQLDAADAARIFEEKLKAALLAEDGQLALSRLAGTTVSTLMPKIETQGQVGGTRWRLVSAPSIPGLLSLDPSLADPSNILSSITMGTEVEIQFGKKLQAAMVRKLQESDVTTQWSLNYKLNSKLRMQFNLTSAPPFPKTLMFQYSSEGGGS